MSNAFKIAATRLIPTKKYKSAEIAEGSPPDKADMSPLKPPNKSNDVTAARRSLPNGGLDLATHLQAKPNIIAWKSGTRTKGINIATNMVDFLKVC